MDARVKRRWCAALRSGYYQKCENLLRERQPDGSFAYCALGVLTELYCKEHGISWVHEHPVDSDLPLEVARWAGCGTDPLLFPADDFGMDEIHVSDANDSGHHSFVDLADMIDVAPLLKPEEESANGCESQSDAAAFCAEAMLLVH